MTPTKKDFPILLPQNGYEPVGGGVGVKLSFSNLDIEIKEQHGEEHSISNKDVLRQIVVEEDGIIFIYKEEE
tara:strand:- start:1303 stop:1518 length:216 start_codon:yes stop_codon:yes gene_type:complete